MIHIGSLLHPVRKQQAFFLLGFLPCCLQAVNREQGKIKGIKVDLVLDKDGGFELYYNIQYGIIWFILLLA